MKKLWIVTTSNQKSHNTSKTGLPLTLQWKLNFMNFVSKDSISNSLQYNKYLIMKHNSSFAQPVFLNVFWSVYWSDILVLWYTKEKLIIMKTFDFKFDYDLSNILTCYDFETTLLSCTYSKYIYSWCICFCTFFEILPSATIMWFLQIPKVAILSYIKW